MRTELRRWHFGVLSFTGIGHLNPLIALSQELSSRGHKVTFFEKPKIEGRVRQAGLEFVPVCDGMVSKQQAPRNDRSSLCTEIATLRFNLTRIVRDINCFLDEMPTALARAGVDTLLINEIALTGPTVAQIMSLPYSLISTSVPHCFGWNSLSWFTGYRYSASSLSWLRGALLELSVQRMRGPILRALDEHRRRWGLAPVRTIAKAFPHLAFITQLPQCIDVPRRSLPQNFHYAGPFRSKVGRPHVQFPWHLLDGRPVLYASLGTTRNVRPEVFQMIAAACSDGNVQLVLSLGNRFVPEMFAGLPGRPVVMKFAPQLELLAVSDAVITHGGLNTVLEALTEGKPMIVIPFAYDQPAIAARLKRLHVAEVLPVMRLSAARIHAAVVKILSDASYRNAARELQNRLRSVPGSEYAANVIEQRLDDYAAGLSTGTQLNRLSAFRNRVSQTR